MLWLNKKSLIILMLLAGLLGGCSDLWALLGLGEVYPVEPHEPGEVYPVEPPEPGEVYPVEPHEPTISFASDSSDVVEGEDVDITLRLSKATTLSGTVTLTTVPGKGVTNSDYEITGDGVARVTSGNAPPGYTITIPARVNEKIIQVTAVQDSETEGQETVTLGLTGSSGGVRLGDSGKDSVINIVDPGVPPTVSCMHRPPDQSDNGTAGGVGNVNIGHISDNRSPVIVIGVIESQINVGSSSNSQAPEIGSPYQEMLSMAERLNLPETDSMVDAVAFSPGGCFVLTGDRNGVARLFDITLDRGFLARLESDRKELNLAHSGWIRAVAFSPDGTRVVIGTENPDGFSPGYAYLYDLHSGEVLHKWEPGGGITSVAFSRSDNSSGLLIGSGKTASLYDVDSGVVKRVWSHDYSVSSAAISPSGRKVLVGTRTGVYLYSSNDSSSEAKAIVSWEARGVTSVAFASHGGRILFADGDGTHLYKTTGELIHVWKQPNEEIPYHVLAVAFSPDDKYVLTGSGPSEFFQGMGWVHLYDAESGEKIDAWKHDYTVWAVAFSPDGRLILTGEGKVIGSDPIRGGTTTGRAQLFLVPTSGAT